MLLNHGLCTETLEWHTLKTEKSLGIGKWLEELISFSTVITQTLNTQSFSRRCMAVGSVFGGNPHIKQNISKQKYFRFP